ncbi:MAG: hypothetical protein BWX88_05337 [Planctomycetes bacterium ADurb.Bin126]|nr:MAG: hypothetical protein BWX88_05337 [Planctomycetes bacterium ADurb.Bin126]
MGARARLEARALDARTTGTRSWSSRTLARSSGLARKRFCMIWSPSTYRIDSSVMPLWWAMYVRTTTWFSSWGTRPGV